MKPLPDHPVLVRSPDSLCQSGLTWKKVSEVTDQDQIVDPSQFVGWGPTLRVPTSWLKDIASDLANVPENTEWEFESEGGNVLHARKISGTSQFGAWEAVDFIWNKDD